METTVILHHKPTINLPAVVSFQELVDSEPSLISTKQKLAGKMHVPRETRKARKAWGARVRVDRAH